MISQVLDYVLKLRELFHFVRTKIAGIHTEFIKVNQVYSSLNRTKITGKQLSWHFFSFKHAAELALLSFRHAAVLALLSFRHAAVLALLSFSHAAVLAVLALTPT